MSRQISRYTVKRLFERKDFYFPRRHKTQCVYSRFNLLCEPGAFVGNFIFEAVSFFDISKLYTIVSGLFARSLLAEPQNKESWFAFFGTEDVAGIFPGKGECVFISYTGVSL